MRYFIIGFSKNQEGKIYSTVIVKSASSGSALWKQRQLKAQEDFEISEISEITKEEVDEWSLKGDIWDQIEIISSKSCSEERETANRIEEEIKKASSLQEKLEVINTVYQRGLIDKEQKQNAVNAILQKFVHL
jgi:hypothetical protein